MTGQQKRHSRLALNDPSAKTSLTGGPEWPVSKNVTHGGPRMTRQQKHHSRLALNDPSAKTSLRWALNDPSAKTSLTGALNNTSAKRSLTWGTKWLFRCLDCQHNRRNISHESFLWLCVISTSLVFPHSTFLIVPKLANPHSRTARKLETSFVSSWEKSFESIYSRATLFSEAWRPIWRRGAAARKGIRTLISNFWTVGPKFYNFPSFHFHLKK